MDLLGGQEQHSVVAAALELGPGGLDVERGDDPWLMLEDPESNAFCAMEDSAAFRATGPIASLPLDSADADPDVEFWAWMGEWIPAAEDPRTLRHPTLRGPLLSPCQEPAAKADAKDASGCVLGGGR